MIKNVLSHLGGIENYGIVSICLFFATFLFAVAWALFQKKALVQRMESLPLDGGEVTKGDSRHE
jgi:hypothetical protein